MDDDEEHALLASLQASRHDQDDYEDQVIRDATHQLAPTLTGVGFPPLDSLVHSGNNHQSAATVHSASTLSHVRTVLVKTRKAQQQTLSDNNNNDNALLHHVKEQILLSYLQTVGQVPKEDLPVRKNEGVWLQQRRKQELEQQRIRLETKPAPEVSLPAKRSVSFGPPVASSDEARSAASRKKAPRVSIMKRKQQLSDETNAQGVLKTTMEDQRDPEETEQRRQELRRLRLERQKRKNARRRVWQSDDNNASSSSSDDEFGKPRKKARNDDSKNKTNDKDDDCKPAARDLIQEETSSTAAAPRNEETSSAAAAPRTPVKDENGASKPVAIDLTEDDDDNTSEPVVCPLCQARVDCSGTDKDAALSEHIHVCQQQGKTRRQSARLTRSSRRAVASYKEVDDSDCDEEDDYQPHKDDTEEDDPPHKNDTESSLEPPSQPTQHKKKRKRIVVAATPKTSPALDDLEEWVYEDRVDAWIDNGLEKMRKMSELEDNDEEHPEEGQDYRHGLLVPGWVHDRLFGYQREGLHVMWGWHQQQAGGILGDEMGLGKTVSISAFLGSLVSCRKLTSVLLVVPATMLNHWLTELSIWAPGIRRILIHASGEVDGISRTLTPKLLQLLDKWVCKSRANRVYECIDEADRTELPPHSFVGTGYAILTTYENVRRNPDTYVNHDFSYVILDEAQKIKNSESDVTVAIKRIRTPHRIAMSGTPIMNDLKELWSLFDFVFPGRLGTLPTFEQEFADPIRKGGYSNASPMQVQLAYRCALVLKDLIEPYLLRRLKKEVKEVSRMPSKTEHVLFCRLSAQQRSLYEAYLRSDGVSRVIRGTGNLLAAVTMLRKICNHPDLVCDPDDMDKFIKNGFVGSGTSLSDDEDGDDDDEEEILDEETLTERSGKLEVLSKILPLWKKQGHRVLIFCQWRKMLNIVQRFMMLRGWKFGRLDGNTNVAARQRLVDAFNEDESYFAMLCTTRTGGVGLNLTGASRVVLYSPDWNPQIDAQARERAWRFGQKKDVTVYRLITAGTCEEKIYHRQIFKTALSNRVLQDPRQRRLFSQRDLRDLFSLKKDTGSLKGGAEGVTETGEMTRGAGVIDVDNPPKAENETNNLKDVMKSKGLAGVFDHDFVEEASSAKSATAREMEEQAKRVAQEAVKALENSVAAERSIAQQGPVVHQRFGASSAAAGGMGGASSASLLGALKNRATEVNMVGTGAEDLSGYTELLRRIKDFVKRRRPSTDAILKAFSDIPSKDVAIFRRLLKSVASLEGSKWVLKSSRAS